MVFLFVGLLFFGEQYFGSSWEGMMFDGAHVSIMNSDDLLKAGYYGVDMLVAIFTAENDGCSEFISNHETELFDTVLKLDSGNDSAK